MTSVLKRNNIRVLGSGAQPMLFAHGFGCDQNMWRKVEPAFRAEYKTIVFDHVGSGGSDLAAYDRNKYSSLQGYASDVLEICDALDLHNVIFVGHSVSAMIGILAANKNPSRFSKLILIGPSPRYINDGDYVGGFEKTDIDQMFTVLESNYLGWSSTMAPVIMGNPEKPELGQELTDSFCRNNPDIARHFAHTTFLSDNRADLALSTVPSLILQCSEDVIAPTVVGEYVHRHLPSSTLAHLNARGHCPNLSAPEETTSAIRQFLAKA